MPLTVDELRDEIANHLQDPAALLLNRDQLLEFLNSAAWDSANEGWVIDLQDDESINIATGTFEYAVPTGFSYIHDLFEETTAASSVFTNWIPWSRWRLKMGLTNQPVIWFDDQLFTINNGFGIRILGQGRPTTEYTSGSANIDTGMESFIRERAVAYAARNLSRHGGQHAQQYGQLAQEAFEISEMMLKHQAELFQPKRFSRKVPGR